jgi:transcriptional regulator with XRE-family HTH domain
MQLAPTLEAAGEASPLAAARLHRRLTQDEAARRAGLTLEEVTWLEDGRVYRFASTDDAILATLLYASALGIEHREALELAGRPVEELPLHATTTGRAIGIGGIAAVLCALLALVVVPAVTGGSGKRAHVQGPPLPPPWKISVDVLNGSGDITWTRQTASRVGALAYHVERVAPADRFDYRDTTVWYEPGGRAVAARLAHQLGVGTKALPGGTDPNRLIVIVGPHRGP